MKNHKGGKMKVWIDRDVTSIGCAEYYFTGKVDGTVGVDIPEATYVAIQKSIAVYCAWQEIMEGLYKNGQEFVRDERED